MSSEMTLRDSGRVIPMQSYFYSEAPEALQKKATELAQKDFEKFLADAPGRPEKYKKHTLEVTAIWDSMIDEAEPSFSISYNLINPKGKAREREFNVAGTIRDCLESAR